VLADELASRRKEVAAIDARLTQDVDRLISYVGAGGKRLRPQFLCWGWIAAQSAAQPDAQLQQPPMGVMKAAAALELIQACALLHDDIIDRSDTRRGRPSVHRSVEKFHASNRWAGDPAHFGISSALLLGDLALAWADDLFTDGITELGQPVGAIAPWRAMRTEVLAGQMLDLRITADSVAHPETAAADAMVVNRFKTAAYTVERPLHLGAALASASDGIVTALRAYGVAIGLGFQLRDDLLGVFGDPAVTGKPAGGDLIEGKKTVLLAMARSDLAGTPPLLAELDAGLGVPLSAQQLTHLTSIIAGTDAPAAVESQITALLEEAKVALTAISSPARENLHRLALAATARDR